MKPTSNQQDKAPTSPRNSDEQRQNHSGDKPKRLLAEEVVRTFLDILGRERFHSENDRIPIDQLRNFLNQGSGVLDVAGGAGHVSMALGSLGIRSTVIDSRATVGKLPKRDRKIWKRRQKKSKEHDNNALKNNDFMKEFDYCQIIPYETHRAWFGTKPKSFRHPDEDDLPVVSVTSDSSDYVSSLLDSASALIALHPDEATGDIVEAAVSM